MTEEKRGAKCTHCGEFIESSKSWFTAGDKLQHLEECEEYPEPFFREAVKSESGEIRTI